MTPVNIVDEIQRVDHVQISYKVTWEARELARIIINGTHEEYYAGMPSYHEQPLESNLGSFITLERTATNQFHRLFLFYCTSAKGFASCKPLLGVDGTHLRSRFQGILLTATATDAEGQLFPLVFSVVDIEAKLYLVP
jgi:zinc finger SWIM domain-containing protein 3